MNILVLNPGSSSLKFGLFRFPESNRIAGGVIENVSAGGMDEAVRDAVLRLRPSAIDGVGCRVVHGGAAFLVPAQVDASVLDEIRGLSELAPLHNASAITVMESVQRELGPIPIVAVFDTSFHHTIPAVASTYAVPESTGIRRYGFHGISYSYVSRRLSERAPAASRVILCHLGNGSSVCAVADGKSVDTSMGLTPLEGLVMGTRSGDLDPGAILYLLRKGSSAQEVADLLNHRSGLLGLSQVSSDVREIERHADRGNERAALALDVFAYRVSKYIGAYAAVLNGLDALVFTAGIGEHSASMRARICSGLTFLGITLDERRNAEPRQDERRISAGPIEVWVIPTDEEVTIARATAEILSGR